MSDPPRKYTKSRFGCITCKKRRLKCDETKPTCLECTRRKVKCGGYVKSFKWRSFEETNVCARINNKKNTTEEPTVQAVPKQSPAIDGTIDTLIQAAIKSTGYINKQEETPSTTDSNPSLDVDPEISGTESSQASDQNAIKNSISNTPSPRGFSSQFSPTFSALFAGLQDNDSYILSLPSPKDLQLNGSPKVTKEEQEEQEDCIVQGPVNNPDMKLKEDTVNDLFLSFASPITRKIEVPLLMLTNREYIFKLFDRYTCGILSIKDGPSENPWRTAVWPLALEHGSLYHAIGAMTKFHTARSKPELRAQAVDHMKESFSLLASGLSDKTIPPDIALATTLSLAFAESWDRHITTGIAHLRGASSMLKVLIRNHDKSKPLHPWLQFLFNSWLYLDVLSRLTAESADEQSFLEVSEDSANEDEGNSENSVEESSEDEDIPSKLNRSSSLSMERFEKLVNGDVFEDNVDSESLPDPFNSKHQRSYSVGTRPKKHRYCGSISDTFGLKEHLFMNRDEQVDPLMGCAQTLFPLIGKVGSLVHRVRKTNKNSLSMISQAAELKRQLDSLNATLSQQMNLVEDPTWDLNSCLATAEAYRYAALLYLHQAVPEIPSLSAHDLAEKVMILLASIPTSSRTCIIHIFPLLVAGCEAEGEEREWVSERWQMLATRMWIGNIDRTIEVVKEVWMRKDIMQKERAKTQGKANNTSSKVLSSRDIASSIASSVAEALGEKRSSFGNHDEADDECQGVRGWCHWSVIMKEWGWEVLLG